MLFKICCFSFTYSISVLVPCYLPQLLQDRPTQLFEVLLGSWALSLIPGSRVTCGPMVALEVSTCHLRLLPSAGCWDQPELPFRWVEWSPGSREGAPPELWLWWATTTGCLAPVTHVPGVQHLSKRLCCWSCSDLDVPQKPTLHPSSLCWESTCRLSAVF